MDKYRDREGVQKPECADCEVTWVAYGPDQYTVRGVALCPLHKAAPRMLGSMKAMVAMLEGYNQLFERPQSWLTEARAILRDVEGESNG